MAVHRRPAAERRKSSRYRRKYNRLTRHKSNGRLTTKVRSGKEKAAVARLKASGFYKKVAALREGLDVAATTGTVKHSAAYIALITDTAAEMLALPESKNGPVMRGDAEDIASPRAFAAHYMSKPAWYTTSQTGICALAFEAYLAGEHHELGKRYLESIVEADQTTFIIVFHGKLNETEIKQIEDDVDFADFDILVEAGDSDPDTGEISDITIIEATPTPEKIAVSPAKRDDEAPHNGAHDVIEAFSDDADYRTVLAEGGVDILALSSLFGAEVSAQCQRSGASMVWEDPNGVLWSLNGERWLPIMETLDEGAAKLGSGKRFAKLKAALGHKPGIKDPGALAAAIGRKKYGAKKMGELSHHESVEEGIRDAEKVIHTHATNLEAGKSKPLTDIARDPKLRGAHLMHVLKAARNLHKKGLIKYDHDAMSVAKGEKASTDEAAKGGTHKLGARVVNKLAADKDYGKGVVQQVRSEAGEPTQYKVRQDAGGTKWWDVANTMAEPTDESELSEGVPDEKLRKYAVPGKSVVLPDNHWWTIASRDMDANSVTLKLSDYAKKDGATAKPNKEMTWDAFKAKVGKSWGISIEGKQYGPKQDKGQRAKLRASNGLRAAPGTAKATNESEAGEPVDESKTFKKDDAVKWESPDGHASEGKVVSDVGAKYHVKVAPTNYGKGSEDDHVLVPRHKLKPLEAETEKEAAATDDSNDIVSFLVETAPAYDAVSILDGDTILFQFRSANEAADFAVLMAGFGLDPIIEEYEPHPALKAAYTSMATAVTRKINAKTAPTIRMKRTAPKKDPKLATTVRIHPKIAQTVKIGESYVYIPAEHEDASNMDAVALRFASTLREGSAKMKGGNVIHGGGAVGSDSEDGCLTMEAATIEANQVHVATRAPDQHVVGYRTGTNLNSPRKHWTGSEFSDDSSKAKVYTKRPEAVAAARKARKAMSPSDTNIKESDPIAATLQESHWSKDVTTKWHPPKGFFEQSAAKIGKGLMAASTSAKQAMSRLNFYINRAGKNLSQDRKQALAAAKAVISRADEAVLPLHERANLVAANYLKTFLTTEAAISALTVATIPPDLRDAALESLGKA